MLIHLCSQCPRMCICTQTCKLLLIPNSKLKFKIVEFCQICESKQFNILYNFQLGDVAQW